MRIVISGSDGQLATDIANCLDQNFETFRVYRMTRGMLDVTCLHSLKQVFEDIKPDVFIQGASIHVVDKIEEDPRYAAEVNIVSLHNLCKLCNEEDTTLVNFSTNYVYSGKENFHDQLFNERVIPEPSNIYGILKLAGEQTVAAYCRKYYNFRVAGLFGKTGSRSKNNTNFPLTMISKMKKKEPITCVSDQIMNITYTVDAAKVIREILANSVSFSQERVLPYGLYHLVNSGETTWFDVAVEIRKLMNLGQVVPIAATNTEQFYRGNRPLWTPLSNRTLADKGYMMDRWENALKRFMIDIGEITE